METTSTGLSLGHANNQWQHSLPFDFDEPMSNQYEHDLFAYNSGKQAALRHINPECIFTDTMLSRVFSGATSVS